MVKVITKTAGTLLVVLSAVVAMRGAQYDNEIDSLIVLRQNVQGVKRAEVDLEISFISAKVDKETSRDYAFKALKYAVENNDEEYKYKAFFRLGMANYYGGYYDSTIYYLKQSQELSRQFGDMEFSSESALHLGSAMLMQENDQEKALEYFRIAILDGHESDSYRVLGGAYSATGNLFRVMGGYEKALQYILEAEKNYRLAGFKEGEAWINYLIGRLYESLKLFDDAEEAYLLSLEQYRELAEIDGIYHGVSMLLETLSSFYNLAGRPDAAEVFNREALEIYLENNQSYGLASCYRNLADIELMRGNFEMSMTYLLEAQQENRKATNNYGLAMGYYQIGNTMKAMGKLQDAYDSLQVGLALAESNQQVNVIIDMNRLMGEIKNQLGDHAAAFRHLNDQMMLADSIALTRSTRKISQIQTLAELEDKEREIRILESDNQIQNLTLEKERFNRQRILLLSIILLGLLISVIVAYFSKQKAWKIQKEQKERIEKQGIELSGKNRELNRRQIELEHKNSELKNTVEKLEEALNKVHTLSGLLPICANCKKIRDDKGYWNQLEHYISDHSEADFSHSICPECSVQLYPELYGTDNEKDGKKST